MLGKLLGECSEKISGIRVLLAEGQHSRRTSGRIGMNRRMLDQTSTIRGHSRAFTVVCVLVAIFVFLSFTQAEAVSVPVHNPSFESPVFAEGDGGGVDADGWDIAPGPGYAGCYHLSAAAVPVVPDGVQVGFAGIGGSLTQTVSSVQPNTVYTLQVYVGRRLDGSNTFFDHKVRLVADTTIVAEGEVSALDPGEFKELTVTFGPEPANSPLVGSPLKIQLFSPVPVGSQVLFDNVRLEEVSDSDNDGVSDDADECPNSDLNLTVVIDDCNSEVPNTVFPSGCTTSDLIAACADSASNHGQFVSCVSHVTNGLKKVGTITGQQKGAIQSCAAKAHLP